MVPQVTHMCKGEISHRDATMLAPLVLFLNQYFNTFISEGPLLYLALVWVTLDLMWYCSKVKSHVTLEKNLFDGITTSTPRFVWRSVHSLMCVSSPYHM